MQSAFARNRVTNPNTGNYYYSYRHTFTAERINENIYRLLNQTKPQTIILTVLAERHTALCKSPCSLFDRRSAEFQQTVKSCWRLILWITERVFRQSGRANKEMLFPWPGPGQARRAFLSCIATMSRNDGKRIQGKRVTIFSQKRPHVYVYLCKTRGQCAVFFLTLHNSCQSVFLASPARIM